MNSKLLISIFPLNGVILYPGTSLPLNIFEPKYIDMIDYALKKDRFIGMIQAKENGNLYDIGCLGKISSFDEVDDGKYMVNLVGKNFFTVSKEIRSKKKFRIVEASINTNYTNIEKKFNINEFKKDILIEKYVSLISAQRSNFDINLIEKIEPIMLIKFIAMSFPFSTTDKQFLLETYDLNELAEKIINLFDFYLQEETNNKSLN